MVLRRQTSECIVLTSTRPRKFFSHAKAFLSLDLHNGLQNSADLKPCSSSECETSELSAEVITLDTDPAIGIDPRVGRESGQGAAALMLI